MKGTLISLNPFKVNNYIGPRHHSHILIAFLKFQCQLFLGKNSRSQSDGEEPNRLIDQPDHIESKIIRDAIPNAAAMQATPDPSKSVSKTNGSELKIGKGMNDRFYTQKFSSNF